MSGNPIERVFSNEERVRETVVEARRLFGERTTTIPQYEAMKSSLVFAAMYAPENMLTAVWATLDEATMREAYFMAYIWSAADVKKYLEDK